MPRIEDNMIRTIAATVAAMLLATQPISAQQVLYSYTYMVPLTVSQMPANTFVNVVCTFYSLPNLGGSQMSTADVPVKLVNGSVATTVSLTTVVLSPPSSYQCFVRVTGPKGVLNVQLPDLKPQAGWSGTMVIQKNL